MAAALSPIAMDAPRDRPSAAPAALDAAWGWGPFSPLAPAPAAPADTLAIAVVPFRGEGLAHDAAFLADAVTEDLIADLSAIPGVRIIGRSTMFTYKGRPIDARRVGQELGVGHVVEGSLRQMGDELRVTVHLVDATDGVQVWAERLAQRLDEWPRVGHLLTGRIARQLNFELMDAGVRSGGVATRSPALDLAMRGWIELFSKPQTRRTNDAALALIREALALDPDQRLAWIGLAYATWRAANFGWSATPRDLELDEALAHARRAVELDPRAADAHYVLGQVLQWKGEIEQAQSTLLACLVHNPNHAPAHGALAQSRIFLGHPEEAEAHCRTAFALSPREPLRAIWHWNVALAHLLLNDPRAALAEAERSMAVNSDYPFAYMVAAAAHRRLGESERAQAAFAAYLARSPFKTTASLRDRYARSSAPRYRALIETAFTDLEALGLPPG